jgi:hypothetical protein
MAGTYGTFPTPSSSMAAPIPRNPQDDAESSHSGKRTNSVDDQQRLARVTSRTDEDTVVEQDIGVTRIEVLYRVFGSGSGKAPIWLFYASIGLISYAYSLSSNTVSNFFSFATSAFGKHSILGTVEVAIYVLGAVGAYDSLPVTAFHFRLPIATELMGDGCLTAKPFIAKLSDTTSRPTAYLVSLLFYVLGFVVVASAQNVNALAAGMFKRPLCHVARPCVDLRSIQL